MMRGLLSAGVYRTAASIAIALTVVFAFLTNTAGQARAADLPDAITGVSIQQTGAGIDEALRLDLTFAVPDTAAPGDTFSLTLPPELRAMTTGFNLTDAQGNVIATAVVVNGVVTFTLSDYVLTHDDVTGSAFFTVKFDQTVVEPGQEVDLTFTTNGTTYTDTVNVDPGVPGNPTNRDRPVKYQLWTDGEIADSESPVDALTWGVESMITPANLPSSTVTIADTPGPGSEIDCATVAVRETNDLDANGKILSAVPVPADRYQLTCTATGASVIVTGVAPGTLVILLGKSTITDPTLDEYTNAATVNLNGTTLPASATTIRYGAGGEGSGNLQPAIDIEKWSTVDGYPAGDYDDAPGKDLAAGTPEAITFTITNTGTEALVDVIVSDTTDAGPALTDISCDFSGLGGPATGVTWAGPFAPDDTFDCTATLPAMSGGEQHSDTAAVNGVGEYSGKPVTDKDTWHGTVPPTPAIDIEKWSTVDGYPAGDYDDAPGKTLDPAKPEAISMTITNTGNEALLNIVVTDQTTVGSAVEGLSCDFSPLGGPATGTTWAGPFAPGASFTCTATLPALGEDADHSDVAAVTGTGQYSGTPVKDQDRWNGTTPPTVVAGVQNPGTPETPVVAPTAPLAYTGVASVIPMGIGGLALTVLGGVLVLFTRRRTTAG